MRVLITGHRGFIGRHFWAHLDPSDHSIHGVDIADGEDSEDCRTFFAEDDMHYDLVIHCAAVVGGRATIDGEPLRLAAEDLSIDAALFSWALRTRPGRIVYFSSSAAYPTWFQRQGQMRRLREADICVPTGTDDITMLSPDQTYGWVKLTGERLAAEANAVGIKTHVFRPFSGYGSDQAPEYPFPALVARAAGHESPFTIWGRGDSARDWIHVDDIVGAVMAAIEYDVLGPVNLCTGQATTFQTLAWMCMDAAGYQAPIAWDVDAPTGVHWRVGDPTSMNVFYTPQVTLGEGITRAVAELEAAA